MLNPVSIRVSWHFNFCLFVCAHVHAHDSAEETEGQLAEISSCLHHVGPEDPTGVIRFGIKCLYPLSPWPISLCSKEKLKEILIQSSSGRI